MFAASVPVLSLPALLLAGLAGSPHCAAMCGAFSLRAGSSGTLQERRDALMALHGGRILGYAALGGVAGYAGQQLLRHMPDPSIGHWLQLASALALAANGAMLLRHRSGSCCPPQPAIGKRGDLWRSAGRGALWALMPCGLLYSMLLLAAFSASAINGAALIAAFAIGGTPLLAGIGWSGARLFGVGNVRRTGGVMIAAGLAASALILALPALGVSAWCAVPR